MKKLAHILLIIFITTNGFSQNENTQSKKPSEKYWFLIPAPHAADQLDHWRNELQQWKDSLLTDLHYDDSYYTKPEYLWASKSYATFFLMASDISLYDENWNYNIKGCLSKYEKKYGGVDQVLLWATYPQLGFDNRDQYAFYRNLPGGVVALKKLCDELHAMGKKLFIAYNPWDNTARINGKNDEAELIQLVHEIGADGIFLDTISGVKGFRKKLNEAGSNIIFQSEISPDPAMLPEIHQSWFELPLWYDPMRNMEYDEVPYVIRSRWLEQRHLVFHLSRWSHEQTNVIQNAWLNGCGIIIWENIFGTVNELNPRDRTLLASMLPVMRRYTDFFTHGKWTPLSPTQLYRTYASLWELENKKLWTIINKQEESVAGKILEIDHMAGTKYFDLIKGKEAKTIIINGKAKIYLDLKPRMVACILAMDEKDRTADFDSFLSTQAQMETNASFDYSYQLPKHTLTPIAPTTLYIKTGLPGGMINIPVPADSFEMQIHFRQRECGFYPADGVTDISYTMALDQPGVALKKIKLHNFAMDETPVTNAEYAAFLRATHYQPKFSGNFLKNWVNGNPPEEIKTKPVTWITIDDAREYAKWRGKRLPTEEEWQWAAQSADKGLLYPWGNIYDSTLCNHGQTGNSTDVKQYKKGRTFHGLYDMCGNVWQFTESERNDGHNKYCILRGGSWYITHASGWNADQGPQPTNFASKYLFTWPGLDRCATVGFRCVVDTK